MNDDILKQQLAANCGSLIGSTFYDPSSYLMPKSNLVVEPVEGGFIVSGTFPGIGHRRCVAANPHALAKLIRSWTAQYQTPTPPKTK
jgi:hypothetical protein